MLDDVQIVLRRYQQSGKNGDRAMRESRYWDYKVVVIRDDGREMIVLDLSGYDGFHSHIRADRQGEAEKFMNEMRHFLEARVLPIETYMPEMVTTWKKVEG